MLYLICTPIGNLNDFSLRSINTLKEVDRIYAEDTRITAKLLKHFNISKNIIPFHEHNELNKIREITDRLLRKESIAIMSDAGAPLISDPGFPLIRRCIELDLEFTSLPGPSSIINALMLSGIPVNQFSFYGFLPKQISAREKIAKKLINSNKACVFFESAKRLSKTIEIFSNILEPITQISICREMTKRHESIYRGTIRDIKGLIENSEITLLGEFVLVVYSQRIKKNNSLLDKNLYKHFLDYLSPADASRLIAKITDYPKQDIYKELIKISKSS
jgi:16S rRNA (cytidine1402-2'-O)-methyltransferase